MLSRFDGEDAVIDFINLLSHYLNLMGIIVLEVLSDVGK